ncbi:MAG: uroporphyrinogen decarboxylase family protein [Anaerolineae bacterium]|nr:uroporphyrinogen decarboxylase family protein [Anaerolineae bacterium]
MTAVVPLPADYRPDFTRLCTALLREGEPDWVPFVDPTVHPLHKQRVLGRVPETLADELEFAQRIGYDFLPIVTGLERTEALRGTMTAHDSDVRVGGEDVTIQRRWANEGQGPIRSEADLEAFPWPDPDQLDYSAFAEADRLLPPEVKAFAIVGKIFNPVWWLMGLEGFSVALYEQPALVEQLFARVCAYQERVMERVLDHPCVGLVWHADDLAYATGLMVSPSILRRFVFPFYRRMNRECRARGVLTVFHSDGQVDAVIEDIIAADFDAFNPVEPKAMDIVALKRRVGSRLALIGNIDLGYTLTRGRPEEVRAEVKERVLALAPGGGYCLGSSNSIPDYVPHANYMALREAWLAHGRYPIAA